MNLPWPIRALLWPFSLLYGLAARLRVLLYDKGVLKTQRLDAAVISVGNLTVGGTGKTPMVIYLAEKFLAQDKRVGILSRGYRGSAGTSDEVELMKRRLGARVEFAVGPDRYEEGKKLLARGPIDVFLLDDGFQHRQLARDVDVLMLDGSRKLGEEWLLPAGSLREPIGACTRADLLVVTRQNERADIQAELSHEHHIFYARTRLLGLRRLDDSTESPFVNEIGESPLFAFCGIGNPQAFFRDLDSWRVPVAGTKSFRDHHAYSEPDINELESAAKKSGALGFITTEKDEANLRGRTFSMPVYFAVIDFVLPSESEFDATLNRILHERRRA